MTQGLVLLLLAQPLLLACAGPVDQETPAPPREFVLPASAQVSYHPVNGSLERLEHPDLCASLDEELAGFRQRGDAEAIARHFLTAAHALLQVKADPQSLKLRSINRDALGAQVRFDQFAGELPVWPAEIQVNLGPQLRVQAVRGSYLPEPKIPPFTLNTDRNAVRASAASAIPEFAGRCEDCALQPVIHMDRAGRGHAAYRVTVSLSQIKSWQVFVNARTLEVLEVVSNVI